MVGSVRKTISHCPPPPEATGAAGAGVVAGVAFGCAPPVAVKFPLPPPKGARAAFATKPSFSARRHARSNSGVGVAPAAAPAALFEAALFEEALFELEPDGA